MSVSGIVLISVLFFCGALARSPCEPGYGEIYEAGYEPRCEICRPGTYDDGYSYCSDCSRGTYQPEAGQTECIACASGFYSQYGATQCISCPEGQALLETGVCGTCPSGQSFNYPYGYCSQCENGFFKEGEGLGPCLPCPANSFSTFEASECTPCPEGQALMTDGSCETCPPGKFYDSYVLECQDCCGGSYTDHPNILQNCYQCGGNSFAAPGSTECVECPVGEVFIKASGTCGTCNPGQYYNDQELSCEECSYNLFTRYENQRYCDYCSHGSYARPGSTTCFACPLGEYYLAEIDECGICPPEDSYDHSEARCGWDHYPVYETPLPEPFEEFGPSPEPFEELGSSPEPFEELGSSPEPLLPESGYEDGGFDELLLNDFDLPTPVSVV